MTRPHINIQPMAQTYTSPDERIVEYSSPGGGGLISFRLSDDGEGNEQLRVELYRHDRTVEIVVGRGDGPVTVLPEPGIAQRACHDCGRSPLGSASPCAPMGVLVFRADGHGGLEAVPDRRDPDRQALRCMDCENAVQHPEARPRTGAAGRNAARRAAKGQP